MPNSTRTFPTRKAATVVNDTIDFLGAKLNVEVLNPHWSQSRWFRRARLDGRRRIDYQVEGKRGWSRFDAHLVAVELRERKRGEMPL